MPQHFLRRARRSRPECVTYHLPSISSRSPLSIDILSSSDQAASVCSRATPKCFPHLKRASRRFFRTNIFREFVFTMYLLDHSHFLFFIQAQGRKTVYRSKEFCLLYIYVWIFYPYKDE